MLVARWVHVEYLLCTRSAGKLTSALVITCSGTAIVQSTLPSSTASTALLEALASGLEARVQTLVRTKPHLAPYVTFAKQVSESKGSRSTSVALADYYGLPPLDAFRLELDIRLTDWKAGATSPSYMLTKLQSLAAKLDAIGMCFFVRCVLVANATVLLVYCGPCGAQMMMRRGLPSFLLCCCRFQRTALLRLMPTCFIRSS